MAKRKKKTNRFQWIAEIDWFSVRRGLYALSWLAGIGVLVGAWMFGVPRLEAHAATQESPQSALIHFDETPAWFRGDLESMIVLTAAQQISRNPLSRTDLVEVREALLETGWFKDIEQVRRIESGAIRITAQFVQPYAVIRDRDGDHLVDVSGRLLPKTYPEGGARNMIAITGTRFRRPDNPGDVWDGNDVTAALRLLQLIEPEPWIHQVRAIDVTSFVRGKPIRLITDRESAIIWGAEPGEERAGEIVAEEKLRRLNYLFQKLGRIDAGHTGVIDLTDPDKVSAIRNP